MEAMIYEELNELTEEMRIWNERVGFKDRKDVIKDLYPCVSNGLIMECEKFYHQLYGFGFLVGREFLFTTAFNTTYTVVIRFCGDEIKLSSADSDESVGYFNESQILPVVKSLVSEDLIITTWEYFEEMVLKNNENSILDFLPRNVRRLCEKKLVFHIT